MTDVREWYVLTAAALVLVLALTALAMHLPGATVTTPVPASSSQALVTTPEQATPPMEEHLMLTSVEAALEEAEEPAPEPEPEPEPEPDPEPEPEPQPEPEPEPEPAQDEPQGLLPSIDADALQRVASNTGIPARALAAYAGAAMYMGETQPGCNLDWALLAAIGRVESLHGTLGGGHIAEDGFTTRKIIGIPLDGTNGTREIRDTDNGELDGDTTYDRAVGPMQFIPSTWRGWGVDASGDGEANPHHIDDASLSAARYLCAAGDLSDSETWWRAVLRYNRSEEYARHVLEFNNHYARTSHSG